MNLSQWFRLDYKSGHFCLTYTTYKLAQCVAIIALTFWCLFLAVKPRPFL